MITIKLPDSIYLAGNKIPLEITVDVLAEDGILGCFYTSQRKIKFYKSPPMDVVLHEFIEAICHLYKSESVNHDDITLISSGLADILDQLGIKLEVSND